MRCSCFNVQGNLYQVYKPFMVGSTVIKMMVTPAIKIYECVLLKTQIHLMLFVIVLLL